MFLVALLALTSIGMFGCVPAASHVWTVKSSSEVTAKEEDVAKIRRILFRSNYKKLAPGTNADSLPNTEFFVHASNSNFNVVLAWNLPDRIVIRFSELGVKNVSPKGGEEIMTLARQMENEFGNALESSRPAP